MSTNLKQVMAGWMTVVMIISQVQAVAVAQPVELSQLENQQAVKTVNSEEVLLDPADLPSGSLAEESPLSSAVQELEPAEQLAPLPKIDTTIYMIQGTKQGADAELFFSSLSEATDWLNKKLRAANGGKGTFTMASTDTMFEVYGNAIVASYEETESGVMVYMRNKVQEVDGTLITTIDWNSEYNNVNYVPYKEDAEEIFQAEVFYHKNADIISAGGSITGIEYYDAQHNLLGTRLQIFSEMDGTISVQWKNAAGEIINPITLENGSVFNHRMANATGWIQELNVTTNYRNILIRSVNDPLPPVMFSPIPGLHNDTSVLIGTYLVGEERFEIYGEIENQVYKMENGQSFTVDPSTKTGFVQDGVMKSNYKDVYFLQIDHCNAEGMCWGAGVLLRDGVVQIGSYKEEKNGGKATFWILGKPTTTEIAMSNGKTLVYNPADNTGFIQDGVVKTFYQEISFEGISGCNSKGLCWMADIMLREGFEQIGGFTKTLPDYGTISYVVLARPYAREITLNDGRILHRDLLVSTIANGPVVVTNDYVIDGDIRTYYKNLLLFLSGVKECDLNGEHCEDLAMTNGWIAPDPKQVHVGAYSHTTREGDKLVTREWLVMGEPVSTAVLLSNGKVLHYNDGDKKGFINDGAIRSFYEEIGFRETMRCTIAVADEPSECAVIDYLMGPGAGFVTLGSFTKKEGNTTITYMVHAKPTHKEITLAVGGKVLTLDSDNKGHIKQGDVTKYYSDIQDHVISNSVCPTDPNSTMPCSAGAYLNVEDLLEGGYTHLGNYIEVIVEGAMTKTIVHALIGKIEKEVYRLASGVDFVFNPLNKTGWVREGNVKENYEDVEFELTQETICPSNPEVGAPCQVTMERPGPLPVGYVTIGSYTEIFGNVTSIYRIIGKATTREITMEDGRILTIDLQKAVVPVITPTNTASIAKKNTPVAYFGSAIPVSAYEESVEQKKKKKRWMNS